MLTWWCIDDVAVQAQLLGSATAALETFREESRGTAVRLVEMETSFLTVDFIRRLPQMEEAPRTAKEVAANNGDRYSEAHLRRIGSNVSQYVGFVMEGLQRSLPKAVVHCQVRGWDGIGWDGMGWKWDGIEWEWGGTEWDGME